MPIEDAGRLASAEPERVPSHVRAKRRYLSEISLAVAPVDNDLADPHAPPTTIAGPRN